MFSSIKLNHLSKDGFSPFYWKGKVWEEEDCDSIFLEFYRGRSSLTPDGAVRTLSGDVVYPDGSFIDG